MEPFYFHDDILFATNLTTDNKLLQECPDGELQPDRPVYGLLKTVATLQEEDIPAKDEAVQVEGLQIEYAELQCRDDCGYTPLMHAAYKGSFEIVRQFIYAGADVTDTSLCKLGSEACDGTSALHACCIGPIKAPSRTHGKLETAMILLANGAIPFQQDVSGMTPYDLAALHSPELKTLFSSLSLFRGHFTFKMRVPSADKAWALGGKSSVQAVKRFFMLQPVYSYLPLGRSPAMEDWNPNVSLVAYSEDGHKLITMSVHRTLLEYEPGSATAYLSFKTRRPFKGCVLEKHGKKWRMKITAEERGAESGQEVMLQLKEALDNVEDVIKQKTVGRLALSIQRRALQKLGLNLEGRLLGAVSESELPALYREESRLQPTQSTQSPFAADSTPFD